MRILVAVLFEMGCSEIHIRITAPPVKNPCYYGIDIPTSEELVANNKSISDINSYIGSTSLAYLPIEKMIELFKDTETKENTLCTACFTGDYNEDLF